MHLALAHCLGPGAAILGVAIASVVGLGYAPPAIEQIREWPQPIVLDRDRFPDNV